MPDNEGVDSALLSLSAGFLAEIGLSPNDPMLQMSGLDLLRVRRFGSSCTMKSHGARCIHVDADG
jgi:hypothetical protein